MCSIIFSLEGSGRGSVTGFEGPGKIERIGITAGKGRIFDGKTHFQETAGLFQTVAGDIGVGRDIQGFPEQAVKGDPVDVHAFAEGFHIEFRFVAVCLDEQDGGGEAVILPVGIQGGGTRKAVRIKA